MGSNCFYAIVTNFLMANLTDTAGLNAGVIGTLIMVSKILDGVTDILFGKILDGTHTKMGKARPWVLWPSFPLAICMVMLFAVPASFSVTAQYVYILYPVSEAKPGHGYETAEAHRRGPQSRGRSASFKN